MSRAFLIIAILVAGCTSPQSFERTKGDRETSTGANMFTLHVDRAARHSNRQSMDLAMLRAAETTLNHGYSYFAITGITQGTGKAAPAQRIVPANIGFSGLTMVPFAEGRPGDNAPGAHPAALVVTIECFKSRPPKIVASNAKNIRDIVRKRYGLKSGEAPGKPPAGARHPARR